MFQNESRCLLKETAACMLRGDKLRVGRLNGPSLGEVPREQKMLTRHLPRVTYDQVYKYAKTALVRRVPSADRLRFGRQPRAIIRVQPDSSARTRTPWGPGAYQNPHPETGVRYRGIWVITKQPTIGPYSRSLPRALWRP